MVGARFERLGADGKDDASWFTGEWPSFVYFVQDESGPIKIGRTFRVKGRFVQLQRSNAGNLRLLCAIPGGPRLELALHSAFRDARLHHEWFRPTEALLALVAEIVAAKEEQLGILQSQRSYDGRSSPKRSKGPATVAPVCQGRAAKGRAS